MKSQLFIANRIKVGFNTRTDTYTGKLGYIIGHDGKKWRKEPSWEGWREKYTEPEVVEQEKRKQYDQRYAQYKGYGWSDELLQKNLGTYEKFIPYLGKFSGDKSIEPVEYENVPTEGFVLNRKAGGNTGGWNPRATYCRVYDPRGFEFEISIPNLLFILQECNAFKGKGLDGSFVYAWDGKDLVLLPTSCEEYKGSQNFTKIQGINLSTKDLVAGCAYKDKKEDTHIYLGKFNCVQGSSIKKSYVFYCIKNKYSYLEKQFSILTSLSSFSQKISDVVVDNYAELMDQFNDSTYPASLTNAELIDYVLPQTTNGYRNREHSGILIELEKNKYEVYSLLCNAGGYRYSSYNYEVKNYTLKCNKVLTIKDNGDFALKAITPKEFVEIHKADLLKKNLKTLALRQKNNKIINLEF